MNAAAHSRRPGQRAFDVCEIDALGVPVTGLAADSRKVKPGDLFLAYPGERADGRRFIDQAIGAGAAAVLWDSRGFQWNSARKLPNLGVPGLRTHLGEIASHFHGHPSRHLWIAGVTGTNGKTSCSHWIAQSLSRLGRKTAVIGTIGSGFPGALEPSLNTTPDALTLQAKLADFRMRGAEACAMEVSSHGIEQGRVGGVEFDVALFTNLSRDHLDYHKTMEGYAAAKAKLFHWPRLKHAIVNLDDRFGQQLARSIDRSRVNVLGYGLGRGEIAGQRLDLSTRGLKLEITTPWGAAELDSPMIGGFNASNFLGVLGVLITSDVPLQDAVRALSRVEPVPGRLQMLREPGAPLVVVDYAHTPDALEKALETLRSAVSSAGRLHCVFGCGGDRDPGKRPLMGEVATRLADRVVITSDNPRSEKPRAIIDEILAGAHPNYAIEEDRAAAILQAISGAAPQDVVLIAGKGHETYQEIGGRRLPFDDAEVAREILQRLPRRMGHA
ncbi:MAG TPA: UDP-N-acetylmuramoyl-L-alanyl-D-glutamate--2,6-diaminopimelate ligase [Burkholderiales bacterium]|jgi:UDP-N-acetylmuramoyl-L-alanyl-D-glutamate--2,6-diaminopimelate ligase|nr:UDP-N-acetylmuramoyl-L-alanyl-D-glutamate--2,6-diaminopimelate ligase [Burkholderiales bacterium]